MRIEGAQGGSEPRRDTRSVFLAARIRVGPSAAVLLAVERLEKCLVRRRYIALPAK